MRLSVIPEALLFSAGIDLCVIVAGCERRLFTPPRLSASLNNLVVVTKEIAAYSVSFFNRKETTPPKPLACFAAIEWLACDGKPG